MSTITDINSEVAGRISGSGDRVRSAIIDGLADKEIERRIKTGAWAVEDLRKIDKELAKIKPDVKAFDAHGQLASEQFSEKATNERKKLVERQNKLNKALDKALVNGDFGDLFNLEKGGGVKETPPETTE